MSSSPAPRPIPTPIVNWPLGTQILPNIGDQSAFFVDRAISCVASPVGPGIFATLYWKTNDPSDKIYVSAMNVPDVTNWSESFVLNGVDSTDRAPCGCYWNSPPGVAADPLFFVFWKANDRTNLIYYTSSTVNVGGPSGFPAGQQLNGFDSSPDTPVACVFQNKIFLFWRANDGSGSIYYTSSADGKTWPPGKTINGVDSTSDAPAVCTFLGELCLAWKANDGTNRIYVTVSKDGATFPPGTAINPADPNFITDRAPAICATANNLYLVWKRANDVTNRIFFAATQNPTAFASPSQPINGSDSTDETPSACGLGLYTACIFWKGVAPSDKRMFFTLAGE